eukprot:1158711-Pelagomonas_calceolata.AAC.10
MQHIKQALTLRGGGLEPQAHYQVPATPMTLPSAPTQGLHSTAAATALAVPPAMEMGQQVWGGLGAGAGADTAPCRSPGGA